MINDTPDRTIPEWAKAYDSLVGDIVVNNSHIVLFFETKEECMKAEAISLLMGMNYRYILATATKVQPHRVIIYNPDQKPLYLFP